MSNTTYPASVKQQEFIARLLGERETTGTAYEGWVPNWNRSTSAAASLVITFLLTLPKKAAPAEAKELEAGVYSNAGSVGAGEATLYRVYLGQNSGTMLAKEIITHSDGPLAADQFVSYEYAGAASRYVTESFRRLSLAEVGMLGKQFDHCLTCGRRLDDPVSVDRGIGPVCAAKY